MSCAIQPKFLAVALRVQLIYAAVSYPGVGRFRRAEIGILGVEQTGGPMGPLLFCPRISPVDVSLTLVPAENVYTTNQLGQPSEGHCGELHSSQAISSWLRQARISPRGGNSWPVASQCPASSP